MGWNHSRTEENNRRSTPSWAWLSALSVSACFLYGCTTGRGVVEGLVFESQREIAIEGAVVTITSLEGDGEEQFMLTDINGIYRFEGIREGLNQVTVVKEGYTGDLVKLADVVQGGDLTLDFRLSIVPRRISETLEIRVLDDLGPVKNAVIDYYQSSCVGKSSGCLSDFPEKDDLFFLFVGSFSTGDDGIAALGLPAVEEFNQYLLQFRIVGVGHRNTTADLLLNIDYVPTSIELFLPRQ